VKASTILLYSSGAPAVAKPTSSLQDTFYESAGMLGMCLITMDAACGRTRHHIIQALQGQRMERSALVIHATGVNSKALAHSPEDCVQSE
jgi:hypothetical protein